jgi:Ca-activated chloride channel family protein
MRLLIKSAILVGLLCLMVGWGGNSTGSERPDKKNTDDKTLSPYFFIKSDDLATDQLPLKSTSAKVDISGVIADVKVTQVYKNEGKRPIEAIYVFPASTRAAVYGMKMTIGERVIIATIKKRDDARREYEQARQEGKSASLLEQQRPNVFQMNVANIMPGDTIKVELSYTELLVPEDKVYEFIYPTVVGPRYSNQPAEIAPPQDRWVENPYLRQGQAPSYAFDVSVNIAAGLPIRDIHCPSHKVNSVYDSPTTALVRLDSSETNGGNRDYILKYRLDGEKIESGLLLYKGEKENFFLLMMQPPKRVTLAQIPGREYIFIVDVSGSMNGYPIELSKKLLRDLIGKLRSTDTFNVLLFSGGSSVMAESSLSATPENINRAITMIDNQHGGGGTELLPALRRALSLPRTEGYSRSVVIATDGYVSVEAEAFDLIRENLGNANMFTFGIGTSVNRHLIEGMARVGMGEAFIIEREEEAPAKAERFRKMIESPVLTQIKLDYGKFDVYDVEPLSVPDIMADRPVIVFGKWRGDPKGKIVLKGISGEGQYATTVDIGKVNPSRVNSASQYLWARHRIAVLSDYNNLRSDDKRIGEVTDLGLKYNLLTAYTSFIAVDSEVRNIDGKVTTVKQPLPLPQGVSDYAVGGAAYSGATVYKSRAAAPMPMQDRASALEAKKESEVRRVLVTTIKVSDKTAKDPIEKTVQGHLTELQKCNPDNMQGKVVVRVVVGQGGKAKEVTVISNGTGNRKLEKCLVSAIKKWQFTVVQASGEVTATIELTY